MGGWGEPKGDNVLVEEYCHLAVGDWVQGDGQNYTTRIKFKVGEVFREGPFFFVREVNGTGQKYNAKYMVRTDPPEEARPDIDYSKVAHVDLRDIERQRILGWPDFHPENFCHRCGNRNIVWCVDSDRFNLAIGAPNGIDNQWQGIICIACFVELHEEATGLTCCWLLSPHTPFRFKEGWTDNG